jgi:hypothetical protein
VDPDGRANESASSTFAIDESDGMLRLVSACG